MNFDFVGELQDFKTEKLSIRALPCALVGKWLGSTFLFSRKYFLFALHSIFENTFLFSELFFLKDYKRII